MLSLNKPESLVQQKKQQWAREREEMSHLYLPWGSNDRNGNHLQIRNQFASSLELHKQSSYKYQDQQPPFQRQRSPSLPPIHQPDQQLVKEDARRAKEVLNRNLSTANRFAFYDEDGEGDTSGYGSETINHRHGLNDLTNSHNSIVEWQQISVDKRNRPSSACRADGVWSGRSQRGNTSEEGRPRWGDRGVATGRLWEPTAPTERLPQMPNQKKGTPSWVERGLNMIENAAEVLVIDQTSSNNSGFDCGSSCNGSDEGRSFLRGQNVPLEPEIKAQRENKRIKALELQSAILNQLEDQEKRRQEEREKKLREEKLEELRIQRQQEEDKERIEHEQRKNQEKQLLETRKLETLKKALEDAERKARQEKEKRFTILKQNMKVNIPDVRPNECIPNIEEPIEEEANRHSDSFSPTKSNRTYNVNSAKSQNMKSQEYHSHRTTECNSPNSSGLTGQGNLNLFIHNVPPLSLTENQFNIVPLGVNGEIIQGQQNGIQLAVLVPHNLSNSMYSSYSLNSLSNLNESSECGKILTPRKYRAARNKDASTQTDPNLLILHKIDKANETEYDVQRNNDINYSNIDENAPQSNNNTLKKERRFRSEERYKKEMENRPKWGVNRPAAQYKKQSEKDPFYSQKRKMRHKHRSQTRQYLSQSSEDSRSPSPPLRSEQINENLTKPRNSLTQSYWRNKRSGQDLLKPTEYPHTETEVTFSSLNIHDIGVGTDVKKSLTNINLSPNKRLTLSQKFINDKYGNRKLWIDDSNVKLNSLDNDNNRKNILDQINMAKRDYLERECNEDQDNLIIKTKF